MSSNCRLNYNTFSVPSEIAAQDAAMLSQSKQRIQLTLNVYAQLLLSSVKTPTQPYPLFSVVFKDRRRTIVTKEIETSAAMEKIKQEESNDCVIIYEKLSPNSAGAKGNRTGRENSTSSFERSGGGSSVDRNVSSCSCLLSADCPCNFHRGGSTKITHTISFSIVINSVL
ncbi:hypothetical protein LSTR_LSTR002400 [Laodelphax striatellus]|uniref:Uncharacterized protein n=1 Tax=Laodelphax striatellus TaxID=195883 RepID=A0A482X289_LAOST|nr:hypothetical protein LSTR_LSTR002400 [Laodelphax striatellus]